MIVESCVKTPLLFVRHGVRGHCNDGQIAETGARAQGTGGGQAVHDRHLDIHQDQIESPGTGFLQQVEGFLPVVGHLRHDADHGKEAFDHFAVESLVIDHQYAGVAIACRRLRAGGRRVVCRQIFALARLEPQPDTEGGAACRVAAGRDVAIHHFGQMLADRQAEAGAAEFAADRGVGLREGFEQMLKIGFVQADPGVAHGDLQADPLRLPGVHTDIDADAAAGGEFDGITEQVEQDLFEPQGIAEQHIGRVVVDLLDQCQSLFFGLVRHQRAVAVEQGAQAEGGAFQRHVAGGNLAQVKQVVDDGRQGAAGLHDLAEIVALPGVGA